MTNIKFAALAAASALLFSGCNTTGTMVGNTLLNTAASTAVSSAAGGGSDTAPMAAASLDGAAPISGDAMQVPLERMSGKADFFKNKPRVALAGYNVGAFETAKISGSTTRGQGASVSMEFALAGVDEVLLRRVADAAHADLVAQLKAAGIDVIDAPTFFAHPSTEKITRSQTPLSGNKMDGRAPKDMIVVGPSGIGAVRPYNQAVTNIPGNVAVKASAEQDAIVIFPNVTLDFVWTDGGGQTMLFNKVGVEGGAQFALDTFTVAQAVYSNGRFLDGWSTLGLKGDVPSNEAFATVEKTGTSNNNASVAISNALGVGMAGRKGSDYTVTVDPARYEALALKAAKGFNAALVQQIKSARSGV